MGMAVVRIGKRIYLKMLKQIYLFLSGYYKFCLFINVFILIQSKRKEGDGIRGNKFNKLTKEVILFC